VSTWRGPQASTASISSAAKIAFIDPPFLDVPKPGVGLRRTVV
jgi:hypothetical protein